ncbi:MAG TPA: PAS domain S-box protein, partial [Thermoanaerobaculia bacterium]|nr:PAS domain S-box protein [Thermoanaerobaculia bacterium]
LTPPEMFGKSWSDIGLPPEREEEFAEERARVMRTGQASQRNVSFLIGGTMRHFDLTVTAVYDDEHRSIGVVVTSRDVTDTFLAEERLRRESQFRDAIEQSIGAGVVAVDRNGVETYVSEAFANMLGWTVEELTGISAPYVYWPPEEIPALRAQFAETMGGDPPAAFEVRLRRKNEERFPALILPRPMRREGEVVGWVALVHDLTNQREVEERLRVSEIRYRELANAMPQIVWIARADGTADYFNDRWYEYTGLDRDDNDDDHRASFVHPDDVGPARERWRIAIRDGTPYQNETRYRDRNGDYHWFLARAVPIRDSAGNLVRWYGTSTDIDEQKRNEADLAEERATAEFLTRANDLFAQSLDYETTLASLADMVVPVIAEWCAVDMIEGGRIRRLAVAHEDPEKVALAYDFQQRFPATLEDNGGIANIVRTGKIEWVANITDEMLTASVPDPEQLAILRQLELRSYIGAPIVIRGEVVGVLTLIGGSSRAAFDERDVWMASELTQRAANAIENARLYAEAVDANRVKDEFLATLSHEL